MSELRSGLTPPGDEFLAALNPPLLADDDLAALRQPLPPGGAPGMPAAASGDDAPLTLEESAKLAQLARGNLEIGSPATAAKPAPAAAADAVPPVPRGFAPVYDPFQIESRIANLEAAGIPTSDLQDIAKRIRDGDMLYRNPQTGESQWLQMPGGVKSRAPTIAGATAAAQAAAQQEQARITAAVEPQRTRAGESVVYPPGSPMATTAGQSSPAAGAGLGAASGAGSSAAGATGVLTAMPGGGAMIPGTPPPQATDTFFKDFAELRDKAEAARNAQYQADLLSQQLHSLPNTGPAANFLAQMSAWAAQMGVPQEKLPKSFPAPGQTEAANKLSTDLLGEVLRAQFPGRITNTDIQTMAPTVARAETPMAANDFMLDKVLGPKLQRDIDRYGHVATLPQQDPTLASMSTRLYEWDQNPENSLKAYARRTQPPAVAPGPAAPIAAPAAAAPIAAPAASPRRSYFNPATGQFLPAPP